VGPAGLVDGRVVDEDVDLAVREAVGELDGRVVDADVTGDVEVERSADAAALGLEGVAGLVDGLGVSSREDDVISGGLAFTVQATERTALEMGYTGLYKDEYRDNRIFGRFSVKF
jgi:hypothetical protein